MDALQLSTILKHYKRTDVQEAIVKSAQKKEVGTCLNLEGFGKRPDVLQYPMDVLEFVKKGVTSFHVSEERWHNPLRISSELRKEELDELRSGWDLLLDIDCPALELSAIAGDLLVQALRYHGIENVSVKFSGNHGFHIGVPFEAFPEKVQGIDTKNLFPDGPRRIAHYLQEFIREPLKQALLKKADINTLAVLAKKPVNDIIKDKQLDPFSLLAIDTILIASRHLFRAPYSINEKSGLVSVVINPDEILKFKKETAKPGAFTVRLDFLERTAKPNEAKQLFVQAFDFKPKIFVEKKERVHEEIGEALSKNLFPPCMQKIELGLQDGRKRAGFILMNFLSSVGWNKDQIEAYLRDWNARNKNPLPEQYIVGQVRYAGQRNKKILPPNCDNKMYYQDLAVCNPDGLCAKIKNPANYTIIKARILQQAEEQPKRRKKEEKKEEKKEDEVKSINKDKEVK